LGPLFALEEPLTRQIVIDTKASAFSIKEVAMNLTEQVVLITGGSRGLGRAFAQALVAAGARVAITAREHLNSTRLPRNSPPRQIK
jgi:NADPH:quinone reductase-like Zn-dependent oxidoreductase